MTDRSTRREFLARSALLAAGVSTLAFIRPAPSFARSPVAEDLVDAGESFRRGGGRGVALGSAPDGSPALRAAHDGAVFTSRVLHKFHGIHPRRAALVGCRASAREVEFRSPHQPGWI